MRLFQLKIDPLIIKDIKLRIEDTEQTVSSYIRQAIREKMDRAKNDDILYKLMAAIRYGDCKKETLMDILENK